MLGSQFDPQLPRESQGWQSLVGCRLWGRTESDTAEATWQQQQETRILHATLLQVQLGSMCMGKPQRTLKKLWMLTLKPQPTEDWLELSAWTKPGWLPEKGKTLLRVYNIPNIQDATQNYSAIQRTRMQTVWSLDGSWVWMKLLKESMQTEKRLQSIALGTQILKE